MNEIRNFVSSLKRKMFSPSAKFKWGDFESFQPVSQNWGFDRGKPIDRYYIENFLNENSNYIKGYCLELLNANYTQQFGGNRVSKYDILDIDEQNQQATIIADLTVENCLPHNQYDCIILTQVLQHIFDVKKAIQNLYQALKPGGYMLITVPFVMKYHQEPMDCWRFTVQSIEMLLSESTGEKPTKVCSFGNLLTSIAFLKALGTNDIPKKMLDYDDLHYPVSICAILKKNSEIEKHN